MPTNLIVLRYQLLGTDSVDQAGRSWILNFRNHQSASLEQFDGDRLPTRSLRFSGIDRRVSARACIAAVPDRGADIALLPSQARQGKREMENPLCHSPPFRVVELVA